jgi:hypothetical protein
MLSSIAESRHEESAVCAYKRYKFVGTIEICLVSSEVCKSFHKTKPKERAQRVEPA